MVGITVPVVCPLPVAAPVAPVARKALEPHVSVIIVNYRQWEDTASLTKRILSAPPGSCGQVEVMVVDNHSPPHRLLPRLRRTEGVSVRRWGRNHGFARAVNEGARLSRGPWLLLLNPDMSVTPEFIQGVVEFADRLTVSETRTGIVGFQVRDDDNSLQPSAGRFPTLARCLLGLVMPRARRRCQTLRSHRRRPVDWVTGCCLLIRRECFEDLGGLDKRFFLYYEDVDLCCRARDRGWSVWHEPNLRAVHHQPLHRRRVSPALRLVTRHSLLTYAARHWPRWQFRVLAAIVRAEGWCRRMASWCRGDRDEARLSRELALLAAEMSRAQFRLASRRLWRAIRRQEEAGGLTAEERPAPAPLKPRRPGNRRFTGALKTPPRPAISS